MLKISTEYRKGVLFIRLVGRLDNALLLEETFKFTDELGIKCVVLNFNYLNTVSLDSLNHIMNYNTKIKKQKKKLFICDTRGGRRLFKDIIPSIGCEIDAFSLV